MDLNYTPLDGYFEALKGSISSIRKKRINKLFVISIIFLIASVFFLIYIVAGRAGKEYDVGSPGAKVRDIIKENVPQIRVISGGFRFNSVEKINFVPKKIGDYTFESDEKILAEGSKIYPEFEKEDLRNLLTKMIVSWATLRNLYSKTDNIEGTVLAPVKGDVTFSQIYEELPILEDDFEKNKISVSGFYLKLRFSGIFKENLATLKEQFGLDESNLRQEAENDLNQYMTQALNLSDPSQILESFNKETKINLMNNAEASESFENYDLYPPFFDDPDFYQMVTKSPVNEFSPIYILKTTNPFQNGTEEYAFATFYLTAKEGQFLPLNELIRQFLVENRVR